MYMRSQYKTGTVKEITLTSCRAAWEADDSCSDSQETPRLAWNM